MVSLPLLTPAVQPSELIPDAGGVLGALYTAEQMKAYGQACREHALEDAAKSLEAIEAGYGVTDKGLPDAEYARMKQTAREHQAVIRRLK